MVIEEVLSWFAFEFAFYSSPIPDQTGHSQAPGFAFGSYIKGGPR
jgi:hypothetical protein